MQSNKRKILKSQSLMFSYKIDVQATWIRISFTYRLVCRTFKTVTATIKLNVFLLFPFATYIPISYVIYKFSLILHSTTQYKTHRIQLHIIAKPKNSFEDWTNGIKYSKEKLNFCWKVESFTRFAIYIRQISFYIQT